MAIKWKFPARTATVHCSGGCRAKRDENGGLLCAYGCVACGACVEACRFGAVQINDLGCAEVDEEKCIGCGACARKCPRGLIDLRRTEDRIAVLCSNRDKGFDPATKTGARTVCDVSCIGCGLCVKKCPADAIHVVEFRAVIDYERRLRRRVSPSRHPGPLRHHHGEVLRSLLHQIAAKPVPGITPGTGFFYPYYCRFICRRNSSTAAARAAAA